MLKEGSIAHDFTLQTAEGRPVSLKDFRGKKVVLYFYPKDDTPGCTIEACEFRDSLSAFKKAGVEVIGISVDTVESHKKFAGKYRLNFTLLADPKKEVVKKYGVWGKKKFMGREYMGTRRTTFIVDERGRIAKIFPEVSPKGHSKEILASI